MKKIISVLLVITAVLMLFVSCIGSSLSGTYRCDDKYPQIDGAKFIKSILTEISVPFRTQSVDMECLIGKLRTASF